MTNSQNFEDFYFKKWTIQELKKFAKVKKLKVPVRSSKEEILDLISQELFEKNENIEVSYPAIDKYINISTKSMKNQYFFTLIYGTNLLIGLIFLILLINNVIIIEGNDFLNTEIISGLFLGFLLFILFYFMQLIRNFYEKRKITSSSIKYFKDLRSYLLNNEKIEDSSALTLLRNESTNLKNREFIQNSSFKEKVFFFIIISCMIFSYWFYFVIPFFLLVIVLFTFILFILESDINKLIRRIVVYVEYCYKSFIEESNIFLKNYNTNIKIKNNEEFILILNNMIDLINYKIFGKDYELNDNYREFQTEKNLIKLLTLSYKFEIIYYKKVVNSENINKSLEDRNIIEYIERIRKMLEYELRILHEKSTKFKYYTILSKYIIPPLTILGSIWVLIQILQFFK